VNFSPCFQGGATAASPFFCSLPVILAVKTLVLYFKCSWKYVWSMNKGYIRLSEVLDLMDQVGEDRKPVAFQIKFVKADRTRGTGGEILEVKSGRKVIGKDKKGKPVFDLRPNQASGTSLKKDPRHWVNATRNILFENGEQRKLHIRLIIEFNQQKVCY